MSESESVVELLGADPWLRFDMWSARAWEMAGSAVDAATDGSSMASSDDGMDAKVVSLFHAAQVAKEFAEMVNPLALMADIECHRDGNTNRRVSQEIGMIIDNEDLG